MTWNWQQPEWPNFSWDSKQIESLERSFARESGLILGTSTHLTKENRDTLIVELLTQDMLDTSAIEGEYLARDSVQSSIQKHLGLQVEKKRVRPNEEGIAELAATLYKHPPTQLTHQNLFSWHRMLMKGRQDLESVGQYRTHTESMQIVSGPDYAKKIHFVAPPSNQVTNEMEQFINWYNNSQPTNVSSLPPLTRAGIAHIWFESIHPFEDGNGRLGRAISEMILAKDLKHPMITGLSTALLKQQKIYYRALGTASTGLDITNWLIWFAKISLEAQQNTYQQTLFLLKKTKFMDSFRDKINDRQEKVLLKLFKAGPNGFIGGLSAGNYIAITNTSPATARRDLGNLVSQNALTRSGLGKGTRYALNIS